MDTCARCQHQINLLDEQYVTTYRNNIPLARIHVECYPTTGTSVLVFLDPEQIPVVAEAPQYV